LHAEVLGRGANGAFAGEASFIDPGLQLIDGISSAVTSRIGVADLRIASSRRICITLCLMSNWYNSYFHQPSCNWSYSAVFR
jgi:hypothetical protein